MYNFCCKTLLYQNLNQNCNILYSEHLIYDLYVCTCVFLLHQESFDVILTTHLFMMGHYSWYQSQVEVKCMLTNLKNDQQYFTVRIMFCPHKDYRSFLGGRLIVFKLCSYGIVLAKVSRVIFGIIQLIFLLVKLILLLVSFVELLGLCLLILLFMPYFLFMLRC
jgi:hypothetical protein